ncbi:MAG: MBL fold metallo-hydrolase [Porticoccus sp.]|nr:MBL fold metallo-hydrolase [Porticoccus sp.]
MKVNFVENLGKGIYCIDARYIQPGLACCYLMVEGDDVAIIEAGTAHTAVGISEALADLGLSADSVRYIIPTHVHLDHAGGAGLLMQQYPGAQLIMHPRGARHMVNPTQLIAGSKSVYGEEKFSKLYGELIPVPEERVTTMEDGEKLELNGRELEFRHTPGHAEHHFCIWDAQSDGWFSGDTFGIAYQEMGSAFWAEPLDGEALEGEPEGDDLSEKHLEEKISEEELLVENFLVGNKSDRFIIPTTSPVQFDPDKLIASIDLMMGYKPAKFYLTHYSVLEDPEPQADLLRAQIEDYRQIGQLLRNEPERKETIFQALKDITLARISSVQPSLDLDTMEKVLAMDLELNAQGLDIWLSKQEQKAAHEQKVQEHEVKKQKAQKQNVQKQKTQKQKAQKKKVKK